MSVRGIGASLVLAGSLAACAAVASAPAGQALYQPRAHAHNDYVRERPLLDAVERGFGSVEVDVVLLDGEVYVGHEPREVRRADTLARLYLDPLRDLVGRNGGHVYAMSDSSLQLLIDVKSEPNETYRALADELRRYDGLFTRWTDQGVRRGPVSAILTGNRAFDLALADTVRYLALDGRVDEERASFSPEIMPLVSIDWASIRSLPESERLAKAREWTELVHGEKRKIRFWGTPDRAQVWRTLIALGVDHIGTDDLASLDRMLREQ